MLSFGKLKESQHIIELATDNYLEQFFQGIFDEFTSNISSAKSASIAFHAFRSFPKHFYIDHDPDILLEELKFDIEYQYDGKFILSNFTFSNSEKSFILEACFEFFKKNGFYTEKDHKGNARFVKTL